MIWTPELIDKAKVLRKEGLSCRRIAAQIPGATRNAVAGMFWRLDAKSRSHHDRGAEKRRKQARKAERILKGERVAETNWETRLFEPYAVFKARRQRERMEAER